MTRYDSPSCSSAVLEHVGMGASFSACATILTQKHPDRVGESIGYLCLIVQEAHKDGWHHYDTTFGSWQWRIVSFRGTGLSRRCMPSFLTQRDSSPKYFKHCMESDHTSHECTLHPRLSVKPSEKSRTFNSQSLQRDSKAHRRKFADFNFRPVCKGSPAFTYCHACPVAGRGGTR